MCTNQDYKNGEIEQCAKYYILLAADYLLHAACIKEKSTSPVYCGSHYTTLVDQVKGVQPASQRELCWSGRWKTYIKISHGVLFSSHVSFKECVIDKTASCSHDDTSNGMSAQGFARAMLDKSLGFLLKQCQDYE